MSLWEKIALTVAILLAGWVVGARLLAWCDRYDRLPEPDRTVDLVGKRQ